MKYPKYNGTQFDEIRKRQFDYKMNKSKEIFDTVYQWGRAGIKVDYTCQTYQKAIEELLAETRRNILNEAKDECVIKDN